ncbi:hypothetical protein H0H92_015335 [Tricholoma furcatifolium]|nr:hypothetical protein H0H92_015335 [Tricholoma furcatifolium]
MTSEEGLQMLQEERAVREEKERRKQEKQSRKEAVNKENLNKAELGDIAAALGLEMQIDDKRTKAQLFELFTQKFEENPELKNDPRFLGLFKRGQKRPAPLNDDSISTTPPHRRLNLVPPSTPRPDHLHSSNYSQSLPTLHPSTAGPSRLTIDHYSAHTYTHHPPTYPAYYPMHSTSTLYPHPQ